MSEHDNTADPVESVADLPPFWELRVYRHPSVPAPLVLCRVCGLAVVDVYVLIHRRTCVIPSDVSGPRSSASE